MSVSPTQAIKPRPSAARPKVRIGRQRQVYFYDGEGTRGRCNRFPEKCKREKDPGVFSVGGGGGGHQPTQTYS